MNTTNTTPAAYLSTDELEQGKAYHIKKSHATTKDELWITNAILSKIEKEWAQPTILTFTLEDGSGFVIDGDFVGKVYLILASKSEKLKSSDYYINYYGHVINIQNTDKILCLHVSGGGYGGGSDRTWWSKFDLYVTSDYGSTLEKVGEAGESGNGCDVSCSFTIKGNTHHFSGLSVTSFFNTIFKRD